MSEKTRYEARWTQGNGGEARTGRCMTATHALISAAGMDDAHERARVFAVDEDGSETPLPTYEEALAENARFKAAQSAERTAWARLYDANDDVWAAAIGAMSDKRDVGPWRQKREEARKALRDLGVDVEALLDRSTRKEEDER